MEDVMDYPTQPQLLKVPLDTGDIVYTPDWVARDMVEFFNPRDIILEPCRGRGVFLRYLPKGTYWCEISDGKDFFAWSKPVDWVFGNPPYRIIKEWLQHSFNIADNVVYLLPMNCPFNSMGRLKMIYDYGGIKSLRAYGNGSLFGMDYGFAVGAFHIKRGYSGQINFTISVASNDSPEK